MAHPSHFLLFPASRFPARLSALQGPLLLTEEEGKVGEVWLLLPTSPSGSHHYFQGALSAPAFCPNENQPGFHFQQCWCA